jgi:hypothetical protein
MKEIKFEIESLCPLKMDKWVDGTQPKTDEQYRKFAEQKAYRNKKGELVIPCDAIKTIIRNASKELVGVKKSKNIERVIRSGLFIKEDGEGLSLGKKDHDGIVRDIITRTEGKKQTRVPTYRPLIREWKTKGTLNLFDDELSPDFIKQALSLGGIRYGLLSHRPDFGRFKITKWEVQK